jgi:hypothetical protein
MGERLHNVLITRYNEYLIMTHRPDPAYTHCICQISRRPEDEPVVVHEFRAPNELDAAIWAIRWINNTPPAEWPWDDGPTDPEERNRAQDQG